jgi:hypothetical protein
MKPWPTRIVIAHALNVSISPTSAAMDPRQSIIFNSTVSGGISPYSYQWYLNSVAVSGASSSSWTFTPSSSGSYTVSLNVTDHTGSNATSNAASATVNSALSVSISPTSATIDVGKSRTFTSSVSGGTSPYTYQWYLSGSAVFGATGSSWAFTPSSTGSYSVYVKVTDSASTSVTVQSNNATATVNSALSVTISPTSTTIDVGHSVSFTSSASGGTSPYTYQWYINGVAVSGATSSTWNFTPSSPGSYSIYVNITDHAGFMAESNTASVTVNSSISKMILYVSAAIIIIVAIVVGAVFVMKKTRKPKT